MVEHSPVVRSPAGDVRGRSIDGVDRFLGIPYAEPPTGKLRWKPPVRKARWADCLEADQYGPACPQNPPQISAIYDLPPHIQFDEDCLTLNIWAPENADGAPVMVWIHGGSLVIGSGSEPMYDGAALARRGIVVVTINYRLGALGWLAHPELSDEQGGISGNYGLQDQICALEWVSDNIAAFGGDPDRVTIAGESAGALSCLYLMVSIPSRGLFHQVIAQSPYMFSMPRLSAKHLGLTSAEDAGEKFAELAGARTLAELRSLSVDRILHFAKESRWSATGVIDDVHLTDQLVILLQQGRQAKVPVLTGYNEGELRSLRAIAPPVPPTPKAYAAMIREALGNRAEEFLRLYPADDLEASIVNASRDAIYGWSAATLAGCQTALDVNAWLYFFDHEDHQATARGLRAFHGSEIPFVFGNSGRTGPGWPSSDDSSSSKEISEVMMQAWANFVISSNPDSENVFWPEYALERESLRLGRNIRVEGALDGDAIAFHGETVARRISRGVAWSFDVGLWAPRSKPDAVVAN